MQCASAKGLHRIAYLEWGDPRNRDVLVCVHGLTRSARDFDFLARALCDHYRVVCPDVAGRGESDKLADAMLYVVPQYAAKGIWRIGLVRLQDKSLTSRDYTPKDPALAQSYFEVR